MPTQSIVLSSSVELAPGIRTKKDHATWRLIQLADLECSVGKRAHHFRPSVGVGDTSEPWVLFGLPFTEMTSRIMGALNIELL